MQDCVRLTLFHFLQQATRFQCGLRNVSLSHVPHESFAQTPNQSLPHDPTGPTCLSRSPPPAVAQLLLLDQGMSIAKAHMFLLFGLAVLAARDSVRADAVTLDAERARQFVLYAPKPYYPSRARREYKTGAGVFLLNIDEQKGVVTSIKIEKTTGL